MPAPEPPVLQVGVLDTWLGGVAKKNLSKKGIHPFARTLDLPRPCARNSRARLEKKKANIEYVCSESLPCIFGIRLFDGGVFGCRETSRFAHPPPRIMSSSAAAGRNPNYARNLFLCASSSFMSNIHSKTSNTSKRCARILKLPSLYVYTYKYAVRITRRRSPAVRRFSLSKRAVFAAIRFRTSGWLI